MTREQDLGYEPKTLSRIWHYATPAEIDALLVALRERRKELGREMKRLGGKDAVGEDGYNEQQLKRGCINRAIKAIRKDGQVSRLLMSPSVRRTYSWNSTRATTLRGGH